MTIKNALTIDVEDYYHVSAFESVIPVNTWERYESRVERNTLRCLEIFDAYGVKATFFVLGWVAERHPGLVRALAEEGHEVASHGYSHRRIYTQTPAVFREETHRSKQYLEDCIGQPVRGYRAATYSITRQSLWALDILEEAGFEYDSSIFPVHHDLYGIADYPRFCHRLDRHPGLVEFPLSTVKLGRMTLPIAGGGYFRLFPYALTRWGIRRFNHREQQPAAVYLHPWELDPDQPRIAASRLSRFRHYLNLRRTETRLRQLLQDVAFAPMAEVLQDLGLLTCDTLSNPDKTVSVAPSLEPSNARASI
jgi:polysaccharide deacetylase family protein (PEP-CTERM system associated)